LLAEKRGMPLTHLADRAGVGRTHFWSVLGAEASPTLTWLLKVSAALDVDVIDLLRDEGRLASRRTGERST
jgi:DNA-binding phage protein